MPRSCNLIISCAGMHLLATVAVVTACRAYEFYTWPVHILRIKSQDFDIFLRSCCVDLSSPQISTIPFGHFTCKNESPQISPMLSKTSTRIPQTNIKSWLAKFPRRGGEREASDHFRDSESRNCISLEWSTSNGHIAGRVAPFDLWGGWEGWGWEGAPYSIPLRSALRNSTR